MNKIIVIGGPSGVGKGTLISDLVRQHPSYQHVTAMTTRPLREGEVQGGNYFHISNAEFQKKLESGEIIEHTVHFGNYYGISKKIVEDILKRGKTPIKDCDYIGLFALRAAFGVENVISIWLDAPFEEVVKRLRGRGGSEQDIYNRINDYHEHVKTSRGHYSHFVNNLDMQQCIKDIITIIEKS